MPFSTPHPARAMLRRPALKFAALAALALAGIIALVANSR